MHIIGALESDSRITYARNGVVEERILLLERFEIWFRDGIVHVDLSRRRSGCGSRHFITRNACGPFCVGIVLVVGGSAHHCFLAVSSLGTHDHDDAGRETTTFACGY